MQVDPTNDDRRRDKRYEGVYAEYAPTEHYGGESKAPFKTSFLRNFSLGGVSLFVSDHVYSLLFVNVRLYDPNWMKPIEAFGCVTWSNRTTLGKNDIRERFNIGITFQNIDKEDERRLKLMIQHFELEQNKPYNILNDIERKSPNDEISKSVSPPQQSIADFKSNMKSNPTLF